MHPNVARTGIFECQQVVFAVVSADEYAFSACRMVLVRLELELSVALAGVFLL